MPPSGGAAIPAKKAYKPLVPMKQFFWNKVMNISNTVWSEVSNEGISLKFDTKEVESLFKKDESGSASAVKEKPSSAKQGHILDLNRANNIGIMLARIKMGYEELRDAYLTLNDKVLSTDQLKQLKNFVPTDQDIEAIKDHVHSTKNSDDLGAAEKYFYAIMGIPKLNERMECWIFRRKFDAEVGEILPNLTDINMLVKEVRTSPKFRMLLKTVLTVGNFLNAGSFRGDANGIHIEDLHKLKDTKSNMVELPDRPKSKKIVSLLHYIVILSEEGVKLDGKSKNVSESKGFIEFLEEIPHAEIVSKISFPSIQAQIKSLRNKIDLVQAEVKDYKPLSFKGKHNEEIKDKFPSVMKEFLNCSLATIKEAENLCNKVEQNINSMLSYFGEDPSKMKLEDFLNSILTFSGTALKCKKEINAVEKAKPLSRPSSAATSPSVGGESPQISPRKLPVLEKGDLENAISQLKMGGGLRKARAGISKEESNDNSGKKELLLAADAIIRMQQQKQNLEKIVSKEHK
jgi:diaphanous 1